MVFATHHSSFFIVMEQELEFYKNGVGVHSVSLTNQQLFLIKQKYKNIFSLSQYLQKKLTEEEIKRFIKENGNHK